MEKKNLQPRDMATALDCAIRTQEKSQGGYKVGNYQYFNYMSNEEWKKYLANMNPIFIKQYGIGAGGELKAGQYPPKMASFGSSSRFIYEKSNDVDGFIFEERLDTRVGGTAHLDGFLHQDKYIYVEAKRREIYYPSHKNQEIKSVYIPIYKYIKDKVGESIFNYSTQEVIGNSDGEVTKVTFFVNEKPVDYFDLKQLICHFLGITYDLAKHQVKGAKAKFLYLLYNPEEVEKLIDSKYRTKIINRYSEVVKFTNNNIEVFKKIFNVILQYQIETHKMNECCIDFEFKLVDQNNYNEELE